MPFWLYHGFFSFLIEIFSCPPVWGMILVGICFHERKIIQAQKGIARVKGITKMAFPHFKRKQL